MAVNVAQIIHISILCLDLEYIQEKDINAILSSYSEQLNLKTGRKSLHDKKKKWWNSASYLDMHVCTIEM